MKNADLRTCRAEKGIIWEINLSGEYANDRRDMFVTHESKPGTYRRMPVLIAGVQLH